MAQEPIVFVVAVTDSFCGIWPELVESARAELRLIAVAESAAPPQTCAIVVAAGGEEHACTDLLAGFAAGGNAIVLVGAAEDHRVAVGALHAGATEYFALPADIEALRAWLVERAEAWREAQRVETLAREAARAYDFSALIGRSPGLRSAIERAARVIPRPSTTVLITGETGTGKELLAQAIHYNGPRAAHALVEVNCTALPSTLLEAELFGYEKGAFTDARAAKPGLFEAANGGTLFLDEIGDLKPDLQVKLLKVLEDRQVRRVGAVHTRAVDIRIIAATSVDLPAAVRAGQFRSDLYYRLGVLPIHLPALRDRGDDVVLLAEHFIAHFGRAYEQHGLALTEEMRRALLAHNWPGNVRELRNAIERAALLSDGILQIDDLFADQSIDQSPETRGPLPFPATLDSIEQAAAAAMVERHGGNKSTAAAALGISRSRLYRLLDEM